MHRRAPIALLLVCAAFAILSFPSTATPITLTSHIVKPHGITAKADRHVVLVRTVAPADSDDDGCPDTDDSYNGPGCEAPPPPDPVESVQPVSATTSYSTASTGGCPSYMAAEATSPTAVNPTSGAMGCFQVLPSTAAAMGAACSDVNSSTCVAAICAAQGNEAWAASGATPCG